MLSIDVTVIGGGCVGLTAALGLADKGLKVLVIDKGAESVTLKEPELRVSAISKGSENILRNLGVWDQLDNDRLAPYQTMSVWDKDSFGKIGFDSHDIGQPHLGHIIENNHIKNALVRQANSHENVQLKYQTGVAAIHNYAEQVLLTLDDGTPVISKLVVAADGANSWVRKQLNLAITFSDYEHHAIVASIKTSESHQQCARQVFLPDGPLALLPLWQQDECSIVWSTKPEHADKLLAMSPEAFCRQLTAATDSVLGPLELVSERMSVPLTMRYANQWLDKRVLLMGDAAHTIHPLAGLGMNLGLLDAASLCQLIESPKMLSEANLSSKLRQYERWRKSEAQAFIAAMAGLKELFDGTNPLKKLIRGIGLTLTQASPIVKDKIIQQAMGLKGDLPELAKRQEAL
mgnify:CR=1 FL=1